MHLQLKAICSLLLLSSLFYCVTQKNVRLADPATPEESAKQGIVAFGIYFCAIDDGYLKFPEVDFYIRCMEIRDITLVEIISIDHKNKKVETIPSTLKDEFILDRDNRPNYLLSREYNAIHTILLKNIEKRYAIESFHTYVSPRPGKKISPRLTCPLNVYESFKALPIQADAGEIKFLGIFNNGSGLIKPNPNSPLCRFNSNFNHDFRILESDGWRTSLSKGDRIMPEHHSRYFERVYYLGRETKPENAELKFLRDFINVQKEGYWKIKAEERLAALGYKYENGFVIEVETKKK